MSKRPIAFGKQEKPKKFWEELISYLPYTAVLIYVMELMKLKFGRLKC
jgi:hypothetical protein